MTLVIGEISYTNILPFFYYINRKKLVENGCSFVPKIPAELNRDIQEGLVDIGGISSFAYGQNYKNYTLLPNVSVSSSKAVGSIFLFSKYPIEQLNGKSLGLTSSSATSVHLMKLILDHFYRFEMNYELMDPHFETMMDKHDGCLLIGDDAILTLWDKGQKYYRYDLGELWYKHTGLPMTFAVFAVRNDVLVRAKDTLQLLYSEFLNSKYLSEKDQYEPMIASIRKKFGGTFEFWHHYFQGLCYDFDDIHIKGLNYYFDLSYQHGFLESKVESIGLWDEMMKDKHFT